MDYAADTEDTPKSTHDGEALVKEGTKWMERIRAAEKREEEWRKAAMAAEKAFTNDSQGEEGKLYDFNILHSNVETIVPAIYNSTPIPDVRRRWTEAEGEAPEPPPQPELPPGQQPDPAMMQQVQQAMMAFQQAQQAYQAKQQQDQDAKDYGDMIERAIVVQIDDNKLDTEIEATAQDAFLTGRGVIRVRFTADVDEQEQVANESLDFEAVSWRDFRMGPAKRWDKVPWVAFRHSASRETLEAKVIDPEIEAAMAGVSDVPATAPDNDDDDIIYWEIWCQESKKVKFIREHDGRILKMVDDPLGLKDFFPMPAPVQPITLTGKLTPVCPFSIYRKLADELDDITKRINKIMQGLKVRGIIAGDASALIALAEADDNEIRVETNLEGLAQTGGLDKAIMWWPIEQAVRVLKELYVQREAIKGSIYEITGISDIVRGASTGGVKSATEQQIKTQWGSLRIQKMQRLIERQVRDVFSIMAELITSKFSPQTLAKMCGIEISEGVQQLMNKPILAAYRVDVESDSTVRADLTRQKQDMTEFLQGTSQYFATMGPLVAQAPEAAEPVAEIYASMARVFKLGREAEDALDRLKQMSKQAANRPQPPNPEVEMMKAEQEGKAADRQADMEMKRQELGMKEQAEQRKEERAAQADMRKIEAERAKNEIDLDAARTGLRVKELELDLKREEARMKLETAAVSSAIKLEGQQKAAEVKAENAAKPEVSK